MNIYTQNISDIHSSLAPNLNCLFDFSEISDNIIFDKSGNYNNAKIVSADPGATIETDYLSLTTSDYLEFLNPFSLKYLNEFSIEFWINFPSSTTLKNIFGFSNVSTDPEIGFNIGLDGVNNLLRIDFTAITKKTFEIALPNNFLDIPSQLIVSFKKSSAGNQVFIFVNGLTFTYNIEVEDFIIWQIENIRLLNLSGGDIYKFGFYDRVLTDFEVVRLYNEEFVNFKSFGKSKQTIVFTSSINRPSKHFKFE